MALVSPRPLGFDIPGTCKLTMPMPQMCVLGCWLTVVAKPAGQVVSVWRRLRAKLQGMLLPPVFAYCNFQKHGTRYNVVSRRSYHPIMAANTSTNVGAAAPVAEASKSSFSLPDVSMPSFPEVSAPSPSQALTKAGDILTSTIVAISSKAGEALGVFGTNFAHNSLPSAPSAHAAFVVAGIS
jgi:hypothetical protein